MNGMNCLTDVVRESLLLILSGYLPRRKKKICPCETNFLTNKFNIQLNKTEEK